MEKKLTDLTDLIMEYPLISIIFALILISILLWIIYEISFNKNNPIGNCKDCQKETRKKDDKDNFSCSECAEISANKKLISQEKIINCPKDNHPMEKEIHLLDEEKIVIDRCPHCKSLFLDEGELEKIKENLEDDGDSNFGTGLLIGMAIS